MAASEQVDREVWLDAPALCRPVQLGWLSKSAGRAGDIVAFEYTDLWLSGAMGINPFALDGNLPLVEGRQYARRDAGEVSPAFHDSAPDRWGRLLMDRREAARARREGEKLKSLRAWDYLMGVDDATRMGAIRLCDPDTRTWLASVHPSTPPITDLRRLESIAGKIESGAKLTRDEEDHGLAQLVAPGASLGGARPKAGYRDTDGSLWLAKFPGRDDGHDVGLWEYITYELATAAGVAMPPAALLNLSPRGHTFAVKRFDRTGNDRVYFASAHTLLDAEHSEDHSYLDLAGIIEESGAQGQIVDDLEQLFRRVLFNVLIGNRDDHLRNHGFIRRQTGWVLSPAYDINPNTASETHVLALDAADPTPSTGHVMATAAYYQLTSERAAGIEAEVRRVVETWRSVARAHGATRGEIDQMDAVIDPHR
ncbi:type II toxin-antitoxin system HipA family toxin [Stenotrophomonas bentonitica]